MSETTARDGRLQQLRRQYFALHPIRLINFGTEIGHGEEDSLYKHQDWIYQHIFNAPFRPANDYQRKFLKALISVIEEDLRSVDAVAEEWEIDDRLLDRYSELLVESSATSTNLTPDPSFKTYLYGNNDKENSITLFEAQTTIEAGSTGLRTWTASLFLAEALLHRPSLLIRPELSNTTTIRQTAFPPILELGAGTGFLSIFLSQLGCPKIWSSDIGDEEATLKDNVDIVDRTGGEEEAEYDASEAHIDASDPQRQYAKIISQTTRRGPLDGLIANLRLNQIEEAGQIVPLPLDWLHSNEEDGNAGKRDAMVKLSQSLPADLTILGTDVIYDPDLVNPLVSTIELFLRYPPPPEGEGKSRAALIAATVRNKDTLQAFKDKCLTMSLRLEAIDMRRKNVPTVFWNAKTWEGSEVELMRVTRNV
ncbi:hypothetical protein QFC21_002392 [Naganishia friedmannii]|uniref:Uncharacterized protein n=1 Tax=Naganishia friedmannii TaxID=89922 RepID=A0ACC2VWU0_9TREE|nr:hypothetical protein QFC21_002392 [Naganishia friedmannii]